MDGFKIVRIPELQTPELSNLIKESQQEGFQFLIRLLNEYENGKNTFQMQGEALFGVFTMEDEMIAIGGLNIDPFADNPKVGRLRRFYVTRSHRRMGIGKLLVNKIIEHAELHFTELVLHTDTTGAAAFYQAIGFEKASRYQSSTHFLKIEKGGKPMKSKDEIRERVWETMTEEKAGRFPFPLKGRIPNFKGAEKAAAFVTEMDDYKKAKVIKVNPDSPQLPIRKQILIDGKTLLVPTPRLKDGFIMVKPEWVPDGEEKKAASLSHIHTYGKVIPLKEMPTIDLIVVGSVAIHKDGRRLGKGEGYADREYAIIRELGNPAVPVVTTIHQTQLVDDDLPRDAYDLTVDYIATEEQFIKTKNEYEKPTGILWDRVTEKEKEEMPVLEEIYKLTH
ncbi:5-formyltetrahydrofolate cyclo-ligase [Bacillus sp. Marseille-Q3570]|uniref:5-formyltetrahydrofolate cyclo-ligase n=1 Tax=Bacillus sp. Marseille-Q3570 TaxID=2963522 RepID=UPI0021B8423D|nr:5-formyltetrahydrofolate cyclo-ligase [Bacillus sp. Marseille-Q3570]